MKKAITIIGLFIISFLSVDAADKNEKLSVTPLRVAISKGKGMGAAELAKEANKTFTNVAAFKTNRGTVVVTFDFDRKKCEYVDQFFAPFCGIAYPIFIRLADEDGNILKYFSTEEVFCTKEVNDNTGGHFQDLSCNTEVKWKPVVVLKPKGNVMEYSVPKRDIRDTEIIEIGFIIHR